MRLFRVIATLVIALSAFAGYATQLPPEIVKSDVIVFINGQKFYVHRVQSGDTLYSIAKAYEVSEDDIRQHNSNMGEILKADQTLKIPMAEKRVKAEKKKKKNFIQHEIQPQETLYAIARKYEISIDMLREDNPSIDPQHLTIGDKIWVRKSEMGTSTQTETQAQMEEYVEQLNAATDDGYLYHTVKAKETIYSLSREFGITEEEFARLNDVSNGLKEGAVVRYPAPATQPTSQEQTAPEEEVAQEIVDRQTTEENISFSALGSHEDLNIALMLPLSVNNKANANFVEFYQGFLLGVEESKQVGGDINLTLYNTHHDTLQVEQIVKDEEFQGTNLIVGPIYEEELSPVLNYAQTNSIPVVSPLANIEVERSSAMFQLSPNQESKYDKIANLVDGSMDIYLIYAAEYDTDFESEIISLLDGKQYLSYTYSYNRKSTFTPRTPGTPQMSDVANVIRNSRPSLFIVLAKDEIDVDRILGTLSSARSSVSERGMRSAPYTVLGTSRWGRFNNIDPSTFFRNNVVMITTYHAKRSSAIIRRFDSKYIASYKSIPTLYAYRGYDTAIIFIDAMRSDIADSMREKRYQPLETPYTFSQVEDGGIYLNQEWVRVNYNTNFKVTIE